MAGELIPLIESLDRDAVAFATRGQEVLTPEMLRVQLRQAAAVPGLSTPERRRLEGAAAQLEKLRGHEFGDTCYRRVSYTPVAATRFREYFDPRMPTEEGNATGRALTVDVLSSASPAKPEVLQVLPLMAYEQAVADDVTSSRRKGLGLRVWLARPWFSSGEGERLAVVCDRGGPLTAASDLSREIPLITGDPAHASVLPLPLTARSFAGAEVHESVTLAEGGRRRDLACFEPVWDPGRQAWCVDLRFDTGAAYFPFVRLGLARYQPNSLPGCELSPLVPTAFVQTVPDRTLTCAHSVDEATLFMTGPAPTAAAGLDGSVVAGPNEVVAVVEAQAEEYADPLLGWAALGPERPLVAEPGAGTTTTYTGTLALPDAPGQRRRVVVREYEHHPADDRSSDPVVQLVSTRRLVHADVVPV